MSSKQSSDHSEALNDLNREARKIEVIRNRLKLAERSVEAHGWVTRTPDEMLDGFKESARRDDEI